ncbi:MAG: DUF3656 domain-containing protein, partial [Clostridiales bacterium]|nr:DUF3656 domain-containing protein [Clostridiales bacterium]
ELSELEIEADNVFMTRSGLNRLRRDAVHVLREVIIAANTPEPCVRAACAAPVRIPVKKAVVVNVPLEAKLAPDICGIADAVVFQPVDYNELTAPECPKPKYLKLPIFASERDLFILRSGMEIIKQFDGVYASNPYAVQFARENGLKYIAGWQLNITNSFSAGVYSDAEYIISSVEENTAGCILYKGGRIPLMTLVHCPYKDIGGSCDKCAYDGELYFTDDRNKKLLVKRYRLSRCYFELIDGAPVSNPAVTQGAYYDLMYFGTSEINDFINGNLFEKPPKNSFRGLK